MRAGGEGEHMVRGLQATREGVDEKLQRSRIQLFQARLTPVQLSWCPPIHPYHQLLRASLTMVGRLSNQQRQSGKGSRSKGSHTA